jgi:hypothetical protein
MEDKPVDTADPQAAVPAADSGEASTDSPERVAPTPPGGSGVSGDTATRQPEPLSSRGPDAIQGNQIPPQIKRTENKERSGDSISPAIIGEAMAQALNENKSLADISEIKELLRQVSEKIQTPAPQPTEPSAAKALEIRESFRQAALDAYREEYKELTEVWKVLETKAQGTVTIAGIFIAAAFTFAKDLAATRLDFYGNLLLGAAIACLIFTIIFSVLALKTREVKLPPAGERVKLMADHYKDVADADLPDRKRRFINQQVNEWQRVVDDARDDIDAKERWIRTAQGFLVIAIITAATITLSLLKV